MKKKNAWNKIYVSVPVKKKIYNSDGTLSVKESTRKEMIKNGLKNDYGNYRKWERAIVKVEPIKDKENDDNKVTNVKIR